MGAYNPRRKRIIIKMSFFVAISIAFCIAFFVLVPVEIVTMLTTANRPLVINSDLWGSIVLLLMFFSGFLMFSAHIILMVQGYRDREDIIASGDIEALLKDDGQPIDDIPHLFRSLGSRHGFRPYYVIKKNTRYQGWLTPLFAGVCTSMIILSVLGLLVWFIDDKLMAA